MKAKLFAVLFAAFVLTGMNYGQFSFGVSPGIGLNSTYFGININNKIVPYIGLQYLHAKFKFEESGEDFDYDLNRVATFTNTSEFTGNLFIPNIGLKLFITQNNKLQAYLNLCLSKPLLSGKLTYDGEEDEDFKDQIKNISFLGGEFGFGVEYFLDEHFSLGGEFGLRYLHVKYKGSYETDFYNPNTGDYQDTVIESDYKLNMNPTYSKISLNFYF